MDPKKDILADVDLPGLYEKRTEAVKKQKEAEAKVQTARLVHLFVFWLGACAMAAVAAAQIFPQDDPVGMSLILAAGILGFVAFFPAVRGLQDKEKAATKNVKDMEIKIAFCHQVLEEARNVKVRKYAEAWVEKEMSKVGT
ncbi:MAG TPA: hypothetical protein VG758_31350 [Hyphomicrobiaceae bacterium]|jgi:hypothetical protein|nr:hypothetical protein [Hyphomicrobiaceae bacterium]